MNWLAYGIVAIVLAWAIFRWVEYRRFSKLLEMVTGELSDPVVRPFLDRLSNLCVPTVSSAWTRLREVEQRVEAAPQVSQGLKSELKSLLESKGLGF